MMRERLKIFLTLVWQDPWGEERRYGWKMAWAVATYLTKESDDA